jgi:hypothetical protein
MSSTASTYSVRRYEPALKPLWDGFVRASKNGTFLFLRDYMEYHHDRFCDRSLFILEDAEVVALLPANRDGEEFYSHKGLTYGGFVCSEAMTTPGMLAIFDEVLAFLREDGVRRLRYKTVPSVYHRIPAEEDRYVLFRHGADLYRRDVLSVVSMQNRLPIAARRRRGAAKAEKAGVEVEASGDWRGYWSVLSECLDRKYGVAQVHSLTEIERLHGLFPDNIKLYTATLAGELLAGVVIYESAAVAHAQYIASSERGRELGALDRLFIFLLDDAFADKQFFDFGISNEGEGRILNLGLIKQKEGFGARAVVHDFYSMDL